MKPPGSTKWQAPEPPVPARADMAVEFLGLRFRNPVIPAAGPNVRDGAMLRVVANAGAGGLLAKTVSTEAARVPRPHMAQFGRAGMLNTELWTELPLEQWLEKEYDVGIGAARQHGVPFIASVGYSAADLRIVAPQIAQKDLDAIELSIHYVGASFSDVIDTAKTLRDLVEVPIIAKLSPHFGDLGDLAEALAPHVDAFTCINSFGPTLAIDIERAEPVIGSKLGYGWMSGEPIKPIALRCVFEVARRVDKPVIGVGGISRGEDLIEFFMAGASMVGICTAAIYHGADIYKRVSDEAAAWLDTHGYASIRDVQGKFLNQYRDGQRVVVEKEEAPQLTLDRCIGCTRCDQVCLYAAIEAPPWQAPTISEASCFQCGLCVSACPTDALYFRPRAGVTVGVP